jgi:hypothetical protein
MNWCRSVIATGYDLEGRGIRVQSLVGEEISLHSVHTNYGKRTEKI